MFTAIIRTFLVAALIVSPDMAWAKPVPLDGQAIRNTFSGRMVYLDTPLGQELPIHYRANGTMFGKGGSLARYLSDEGKPTDKGRWWVKGKSLCQKWRTWMDGKRQCFALKLSGKTIYWRSNDGKSGTARLGRGGKKTSGKTTAKTLTTAAVGY